jgi:hypothetical protein
VTDHSIRIAAVAHRVISGAYRRLLQTFQLVLGELEWKGKRQERVSPSFCLLSYLWAEYSS